MKSGCLMAMIGAESESLAEFGAEHVDPASLAEDGLEKEAHVTVLYGFKEDFDPSRLTQILANLRPFKITLGAVSRFENETDVLKFDVNSPDLEKLNAKIAQEFKADINPSEHPYHPHLTIGYVTSGSNKDLDGVEAPKQDLVITRLVYRGPNVPNRVSKEFNLEASKLSQSESIVRSLLERMTFDQLYRVSDPRRVVRSLTVKGPPLKIDAFENATIHSFNFKSNPSTTGLRHHGYIKFFKPRSPRPLEQVECLVDCDCFAGDTLVSMADGSRKPIKDIVPGEYVYTHKGRLRKVVRNMSRLTHPGENVYSLKVDGGMMPIVATGNHPFYTLRGNDKCHCGCGQLLPVMNNAATPLRLLGRKFLAGHHVKGTQDLLMEDKSKGVFEWIKVDDLRDKEWFLSPWIEEPSNAVAVSSDFARLVGYYAAEGCVPSITIKRFQEGGAPRGNVVRLAFNASERDTLVKDVQEISERLGYRCVVRPWKRTATSPVTGLAVSVYSKEFRDFCLIHVGCGSEFKKFSPEIMNWNNDGLKQLFVGYHLGDGNYGSTSIRCFSTSKDLIFQTSTILKRLKIQHTGQFGHGKGGRKDLYALSIQAGNDRNEVLSWTRHLLRTEFSDTVERSPQYKREEGCLKQLKSRELLPGYVGIVWDLTVEEDHSFIANGIAVHNCHDYKFRWAWANKQRGSGVVGANSMNQAFNRAPRITNPTGAPALCKHLLALKDYIYGLYGTFATGDNDDAEVLGKMVRYANKKWINMPQELANARQRDAMFNQQRLARNRGEAPIRRALFSTPPEISPEDEPVEPAQGRPTLPPGHSQATVDNEEERNESILKDSMKNQELNEAIKTLQEMDDCAVCPNDTSTEFSTDVATQPGAEEKEASEALELIRTMVQLLQQLVTVEQDEEGDMPIGDVEPEPGLDDDGSEPEPDLDMPPGEDEAGEFEDEDGGELPGEEGPSDEEVDAIRGKLKR